MKKLESLKDDRFSKFETDKISNMISIKGGEAHNTGTNLAQTCWETAEWCDQNIYDSQGRVIGTRRVEDNSAWYAIENGIKTTKPCTD